MGTSSDIADRLEAVFSDRGFAEPGVAALREAAGVTLRTLYRHFPSREAMVTGALDRRHRHYMNYLDEGAPSRTDEALLDVYRRLGAWMANDGLRGCLFMDALAAHPESQAIRRIVKNHKAQTRALLSDRLRIAFPDVRGEIGTIADGLFLIHEGQIQASITRDPASACVAALAAAKGILATVPDKGT